MILVYSWWKFLPSFKLAFGGSVVGICAGATSTLAFVWLEGEINWYIKTWELMMRCTFIYRAFVLQKQFRAVGYAGWCAFDFRAVSQGRNLEFSQCAGDRSHNLHEGQCGIVNAHQLMPADGRPIKLPSKGRHTLMNHPACETPEWVYRRDGIQTQTLTASRWWVFFKVLGSRPSHEPHNNNTSLKERRRSVFPSRGEQRRVCLVVMSYNKIICELQFTIIF